MLPCPDSDPPPASATSCSHPAVAWLPALGSHPSHRILLSMRRSCVSIRLPPAPRLPLYVLPQLFQHSDNLRLCVPGLRHTRFPFPSLKSYSALCGKRGAGQYPVEADNLVLGNERNEQEVQER